MDPTLPRILKTHPGNFTPLTRTPWGGSAIALIKGANGLLGEQQVPKRIGETWEVSVDPARPSIVEWQGRRTTLGEFFQQAPAAFVGAQTVARFGGRCPLLLKWIHANTALSVQLHPPTKHPRLAEDECGKHEAWLVLDAEPESRIYLGFQPDFTVGDITRLIKEGRAHECLHSFVPKPFDYIAIPPGCVHALGAGVLVAEPQSVEPGCVAVTWRLSDWGRKYDALGNQTPQGLPRALHVEESLDAIDWSLPRGLSLVQRLSRPLRDGERWLGSPDNPFAATVFCGEGLQSHRPLVEGQFGVVTCWSGQARIGLSCDPSDVTQLVAGESAVIAADAGALDIDMRALGNAEPGLAVFSLRVFE